MDSVVKCSDFANEKYYAVYQEPNTYLDVIEVNGIMNSRFNLEDCFDEHGLQLMRITFIKVPALKWSTRVVNINGGSPLQSDAIKKLVVTGQVMYQLKARNFIMVYNLEKCQADIIKIIDSNKDITCLEYGPFDNGHVLVGLENGCILAFEYPSLERLETIKAFSSGAAVSRITFDPTNYIFAGSSDGQVVALSHLDKKLNYLYLDLGKNKYCTVTV